MSTFIRLTSGPEIDGEITVNAHFYELDEIARLDLLSDWMEILIELYRLQQNVTYGSNYTPNELCLNAIKYQERKS